MATDAQIAANRRNAKLSTGPTSPSGKAVSSRNSTKHGLSGSTTASLIASEADRDLLEQRKAEWRPEFDPRGPEEEYALRVGSSPSRSASTAAPTPTSPSAATTATAPGPSGTPTAAAQADELAVRAGQGAARGRPPAGGDAPGLRPDARMLAPGSPPAWSGTATWTDAQRSLALDLLGVRPELRDAETPVDPAVGDVLEVRRAVVAAEVARLTALRDGALADRDADERAMAEATARRRADEAAPVDPPLRDGGAPPAAVGLAASSTPRTGPPPRVGARPAPRLAPAPLKQPALPPLPAVPRPVPTTFVAITAAPAPAVRPAAPPSPEPRPLNRRQRRARAARVRCAAG